MHDVSVRNEAEMTDMRTGRERIECIILRKNDKGRKMYESKCLTLIEAEGVKK